MPCRRSHVGRGNVQRLRRFIVMKRAGVELDFSDVGPGFEDIQRVDLIHRLHRLIERRFIDVSIPGHSLEAGRGHVAAQQHGARDLGANDGLGLCAAKVLPRDRFTVFAWTDGQCVAGLQRIDAALHCRERFRLATAGVSVVTRFADKVFSRPNLVGTAQRNQTCDRDHLLRASHGGIPFRRVWCGSVPSDGKAGGWMMVPTGHAGKRMLQGLHQTDAARVWSNSNDAFSSRRGASGD